MLLTCFLVLADFGDVMPKKSIYPINKHRKKRYKPRAWQLYPSLKVKTGKVKRQLKREEIKAILKSGGLTAHSFAELVGDDYIVIKKRIEGESRYPLQNSYQQWLLAIADVIHKKGARIPHLDYDPLKPMKRPNKIKNFFDTY